jgi:serine/threonine protein kinase/WD40 repeat protein
MTPNSGRAIEIFTEALALPIEERVAFLDRVCAGDQGMRRKIESLLRSNDRAGAFLETPPTGSLSEVRAKVTAGEKTGDEVDRYKLLQQIGEGGCGIVFMAEQETPVRRRVALKIIKPGMDTKRVIARFEAERQVLALMDHPNIAKIFDAGTTESGRPYFVMELVRGVKITEYCDQHSLATPERLKLFVQVCHAVQHAHQKGIIHRDIKPSNILVTQTEEGEALPVIIDFGIAKATTNQQLTDKTLFTGFEMLIGTPAYMSPEQAALTNVDVDTRTDIYSLGVLLYELLTGSTPFNTEKLLKSGLDEIRRVIREQEPVRPSTRLTSLADSDLTTVAQRRHTEAPKLIRAVRGDLDWIAIKALEKDRTRRYATANGMAADVKRYLDNEPVVARPPSSAYRFQKAVRRNKLVFGAATAVVAALVAGIAISTWKTVQARKAQRETEAARNDEQRQRIEAQAAALAARRIAYSSDMNAVQQALKENNLGRARMLLNRQKPRSRELDLRNWEWRYLWSQARADAHDIFVVGPRWSASPLSFSADGRMLAREFHGTNSVVTDLVSRGAVLERMNARLPIFAHRSNRLAFVTKDSSMTNDVVTILDIPTRNETQLVRYGNFTQWLGFTPDDRQLLAVSIPPGTDMRDGFPADLTAWEVDTGRKLWQRTIEGRPLWVRWRPYAISPDGAAFAAALPNGRVQVLGTKDGSERFTVTATEELSLCVMFSPNSATLLTGAGFNDPIIRLWDARSGQARGSMDGHSSAYVTDLLFTTDGSRLISSSADQTIRLWDWTTRKPTGLLRGHLDEVDGMALGPDGRTLASRCKDGSIYLWDLNKPFGQLGYQTLPSRLRQAPGSRTAQFTPDGRSILGVESSGGVALWDVPTFKETRRFSGVSSNAVIGFSPDSRWLVSSDRRDKLRVWDVASGSERTNLNFNSPPPGLDDWKFIDGGKFLVTVSGPTTNAVLESWDTDSWQRKGSVLLHFKTLFDHSINLEPKSFSLLNTYAVMAGHAFYLFDVTRLNEAPKALETSLELNDWAGSPDGRMAAAADSSGMVRIWDVARLQALPTLKSFKLGSHSVAFSPDNRRLAAGSSGQEAVKLWDCETWQEVLTLSGEGSRFGSLTFSQDGRYLVGINDAGLAHLWTVPTWEQIAAEEAKDPPSPGYGGQDPPSPGYGGQDPPSPGYGGQDPPSSGDGGQGNAEIK